ncbi:uncharacterized protein LOC122851385 isoform X2 [Aphidius gifuensis]|uniref:uncharacterized protein LOC122851385 isoform X2 n=1 Tax=Aphidius gifuensis TaxID=684658 RepID=UPI001CDD4ED5|nr:uncharacterized protein LOC122851385 isoform X2 [Aphidius gifuensis]
MFRLELLGVLMLSCTQILTEHRNFHGPYHQYGHQRQQQQQQQNWEEDMVFKEIRVKQGRLRGRVIQPDTNPRLPLVDVFLGVPYAEPPIGPFRFSPPRSPRSWRNVRDAHTFASVCPQVLPNLRLEVKPARHEYLERLLPYLRNQSEDCLYLNIYAPHQADGSSNPRRYPVMVFIHGESYEWNSGNPYDGSVLAAYGHIVFVTINFRLGILGFLRPGTNDDTASNFGLLDQIAALLWLRENIAKFGGDPDSVTLVGHGTGAILANLLLLSPVANNKDLFKRAILMSGSALSPDAIGKGALQITKQVAYALNCPTTSDNELALCLRNRDVDSLLNVKIDKPKYVPAYAPLIDRAVIPKEPLSLMENTQLFGSFDLMYGVTESEKFHVLPPVAVLHGMLDGQRDEVLRDHAKAMEESDMILSKILEHYGRDTLDEFRNEDPIKNRDLVLDALSDSGTVAPLVRTAKLHAKANPKSYMYVFSHPRAMQDYSGQQRQRTVHGEELPYILGVPLDGGKYHLRGRYNIGETLFSEAMMTWWCNFAHTGNPNAPRRVSYMTDGPKEWLQYQVDWPEYNIKNETYFNLTIPPRDDRKYRSAEMQFWNIDLPDLTRHKPRGPRPPFLDRADGIGKYGNGSLYRSQEGQIMKYTTSMPNNLDTGYRSSNDADIRFNRFPFTNSNVNSKQDEIKLTTDETETIKSSSVMTIVIGLGIVLLVINITVFIYLQHRRQNLKDNKNNSTTKYRRADDKTNRGCCNTRSNKNDNHLENLTNFGKICDSKPDINDVIKNDKAYDNSSNFGRRSKLSRQNSASTIDTHVKVKEWIHQEIVHRCSPRFLRKTRETLQKEHQEKMTKQQEVEENERQRQEMEDLRDKKPEPIYDESPLVVRPGIKKIKLPKVSVAIDATPATRTESILNQIPIEIIKDLESIEGNSHCDESKYTDDSKTPQIVIIEHHHSRSDPLPMEKILKNIKTNYSTTRIGESDSGSASSLYAKINPKLKSKLQNFCTPETPEEIIISNDTLDGCEYTKNTDDGIYGKIPKMSTFGINKNDNDINVTCREPMLNERDNISPEEALKTIKRRNYPKVLPDIEKRHSLPAPNSLFMPKQIGNTLKDHRQGPHPSCNTMYPPAPPPRLFGTSKSLDLTEEEEPVTTNLHVGPLLKRQDSIGKNQSDKSIIDSIERVAIDAQEVLFNHHEEYEITPNPKCPVHGSPFLFPCETNQSTSTSRSVDNLDKNIGNPNWYKNTEENKNTIITKDLSNVSLPNVSIGNPNWYKTMKKTKDDEKSFNQYGNLDEHEIHENITKEPRIIITPRIINDNNNSNNNNNNNNSDTLPPIVFHQNTKPSDPYLICQKNDKEQKIISPSTGTLKQPKIIIKPTTNTMRNRERNIPKVSAIPSPEVQNYIYQNPDMDTKGIDNDVKMEKPTIKKKPTVTRIPSFSRRIGEHSATSSDNTELIYPEKIEIVQRINAFPTTKACLSSPLVHENQSSIPILNNEMSRSQDSSCNLNSNTNTIKKKPAEKK